MDPGGKRQLLESGLCVHRWVLQADACCCCSNLATVRCCCSTQCAVVPLFLFKHFNNVQCLTFRCSSAMIVRNDDDAWAVDEFDIMCVLPA